MRFRNIIGQDMQIISPGVGAQGGKIGDAILAGADYEIIGRSIYTASNPGKKAEEIYKMLQDKLGKSKKETLIQV